MRPPQSGRSRLGPDLVLRDGHSEVTEGPDHRPDPPGPIVPAPGQEILDRRHRGVEKITQEVQLPPGSRHGKLAPPDGADAQALAGDTGLGHPIQGVVVGEGDRLETRGRGAGNDLGRREEPVRRDGMQVQINEVSQRWYPSSGDVQLGWDLVKSALSSSSGSSVRDADRALVVRGE